MLPLAIAVLRCAKDPVLEQGNLTFAPFFSSRLSYPWGANGALTHGYASRSSFGRPFDRPNEEAI